MHAHVMSSHVGPDVARLLGLLYISGSDRDKFTYYEVTIVDHQKIKTRRSTQRHSVSEGYVPYSRQTVRSVAQPGSLFERSARDSDNNHRINIRFRSI